MNLWSLLYFTCFIFYAFSGVYVLNLSRKSLLNKMFFFICFTLSTWSLGYSFSIGAKDAMEASNWRMVSTFGWTFFYSAMLMFMIVLTKNYKTVKKLGYLWLMYLPSTFFYFHFWLRDTGNYHESSLGYVYIHYARVIWSYVFDVYYISTVVITFALLLHWGFKTQSLRERKQAKMIVSTMIASFILGGLTDTLLPQLGIITIPLGIVFISISIVGIWVAITKYKMMNLNQTIAAEHVFVTMKDPVIVLNNQFEILEVNHATSALSGFEPQELMGAFVQDILCNFTSHHPSLQELYDEGFTSGHELELTTKEGKVIPCLCSSVQVKSDFGEALGVVIVLHDITNRKVNEKLLKNINSQLNQKISKINNVFDHVSEGILTFNQDLIIQSEYSLECEHIFGKSIIDRTIADLLYPDEIEKQVFMTNLLRRLFELKLPTRACYLSLLPEEATVNQKVVTLQYKFTMDATDMPVMMVILKDVTEKIQLESQMDQERKILKMIMKVLLASEEFLDLVAEYQTFSEMNFREVALDLESFQRSVHTFKGNFSLFDMVHLVDGLDTLEDQLEIDPMAALSHLSNQEVKSWLLNDLRIIEGIIGKSYLKSRDILCIEKKHLQALEQHVLNTFEPKLSGIIFDLLQSLKEKSFHELLSSYPDYTVKLAERYNKNITPFEITGDCVYVKPHVYQDVVKSLVHVFRNCVAHGIETAEERIENNKPCEGSIKCCIKKNEKDVQLIISDDGKGIDLVAIASRVIDNGVCTKERLSTMSESEHLQLIFEHQVSAETSVTSLSGRGIGLAALKTAVVACGGTVCVASKMGQGTSFTLTFPIGGSMYTIA